MTFPGDPSQSDIVAFTSGIGATTYWSTLLSQYAVGPATSGTPIILTTAQEPPGSAALGSADADIQAWLNTQVQPGALAGTNTPDTVYAIYFPAGTTITLPLQGQIVQSCRDFGGYHLVFPRSDTGDTVAYAVLPRCSFFATAGAYLTGLSALTGPASHEVHGGGDRSAAPFQPLPTPIRTTATSIGRSSWVAVRSVTCARSFQTPSSPPGSRLYRPAGLVEHPRRWRATTRASPI